MTATRAATLRKTRTAGQFFPGDPATLNREVRRLLDQTGRGPARAPSRPRAVISPHAGYTYSGALTAAALGMSRGWEVPRIVILSPAHRHTFDGIALPSQPGYALPGAELAIDTAARDALVQAGLARILDAAHEFEHGIETQLPFLAELQPHAKLVPLVIGRAGIEQVAAAIDLLDADGADTLFVLSSDLSHFLTRAAAEARDAETARKIESGAYGALTGDDACGARGIAGYLASTAGRGTRAIRLGMTTSHATTGDASRVVGYGAWSLYAADAATLDTDDREALLRTARGALEHRTQHGASLRVRADGLRPPLQGYGASFVTLERDGQLRGCIGTLDPRAPLIQDVADNAIKAGFSDPRFDPVGVQELAQIRIKISVLSRPAPLQVRNEADALAALVPGQSGAILTDGRRRGLFLPQVWEALPDPVAFLRALKRKAGLAPDHWSDTLELHGFHGEVFGEAL